MTDYCARPMPALGFDPAPGDVGSVQSLARQHHMAAREIRQAARQVMAVDLASWEGQAGAVAGLVRETLDSNLNGIAANLDTLGQACTAWSSQLSWFQEEADALERQARTATEDQQDLQRRQPSLRMTSPPIYTDLDAAQARLQNIQQQAEQLHQDYEVAAARLSAQLDGPGLMERIDPVRKIVETGLAAGDLFLIDHWLGRFTELGEKAAENRGKLLEPLEEAVEDLEKLAEDGKLGSGEMSSDLRAAGLLADGALARMDAWEAFTARWARIGARWFPASRGGSYSLAAVAIVADIMTVISPQDSGTMRDVDRVAAVGNAVGLGTVTAVDASVATGLIAADSVAAFIPVVGEVMIAVTGAYLAADFIYHDRAHLENAARDIGHAVVRADEDLGEWEDRTATSAAHGAQHLWHSVTSGIGSWF